MSLDLLGEGFDLHGGGQDLMFPHHENERAQAVADGKAFARHWMHNGWVEVDGEKMSKSLGNFTSLTDLLARSDARAYRLLVLRLPLPLADRGDPGHHRRGRGRPGPAGRAGPALRAVRPPRRRAADGPGRRRIPTSTPAHAFPARMDDDLDTPGALAGIFELRPAAHAAADAGDEDEAAPAGARRGAGRARAVAPRRRARSTTSRRELVAVATRPGPQRDFAAADALRDELVARGWTVEDTPRARGSAAERGPAAPATCRR